jgi:hypothetical protein
LLQSIGSISGVIFFHETAGMRAWWQVFIYPISIITTVAGVVILSTDKATEKDLFASINNNRQQEDAPLMRNTSKPIDHGTISATTVV